jgi:hypothetical protein
VLQPLHIVGRITRRMEKARRSYATGFLLILTTL